MQALHLLAAMWEGGPILSPDMVSYNTALKACANAFQLGRALDVYREMVQRWAWGFESGHGLVPSCYA